MDKNQALQTVINGIKAANKRGAFELEESATIFSALQVLLAQEQPQPKMEVVSKDGKDVKKK